MNMRILRYQVFGGSCLDDVRLWPVAFVQPMAVFSDPQMGETAMTPEARRILEERAAQWRAKVAANPELAKAP